MSRNIYIQPEVEIITLAVEQGFQASVHTDEPSSGESSVTSLFYDNEEI
ncbi:MAG: hypothetical protein J6K81_06525 [Rikenellaceae bacterium]|nr:hypothetical protein [Rikenellaceae bacterium]